MKKLGLTLLAVLFSLGLFSCGEPVESVDADPGDVSYLPMKINDYWVFERKMIDVDNNVVNYERNLMDSATVRGLTSKGGKLGKVFTIYSDFINDLTKATYRIPNTTFNFTPSGNDLLLFSDFLEKVPLKYTVKLSDTAEPQTKTFNLSVPIDDFWIPFVTPRGGEEVVYTKDSVVIRVEVPEVPYDSVTKAVTKQFATYSRGTVTIKVTPGGNETIKGNSATKYTITLNFVGTPLSVSDAGENKLKFTYVVSYWLAEGKGLLKYRVEPIIIESPLKGGKSLIYKQSGIESTIVRGKYLQ